MPTTNYIYHGNQYLCETDENDTPTKLYVNEPGTYTNLVSQKDLSTGEKSYALYDAVGSTRAVTDSNGDVSDTFVYDAWGNVLDRTGTTDLPFQYVGKHGYYRDEETETNYVMARTYNPMLSRWVRADPIFYSIRSPWHYPLGTMYTYSSNAPLTRYDPSGLLDDNCSVIYSPCGSFTQLTIQRSADLWLDIHDDFQSLFTAWWKSCASACRCCRKVGFVQIWRGEITHDALNWLLDRDYPWRIDQSVPYPFKDSIGVRVLNPCSDNTLTMQGTPGGPYWTFFRRVLHFEQDFETCAVCLDDLWSLERPEEANIIVFGCVKWGHSFTSGQAARRLKTDTVRRYIYGKNSRVFRSGSYLDPSVQNITISPDPGIGPSDLMKTMLCNYSPDIDIGEKQD